MRPPLLFLSISVLVLASGESSTLRTSSIATSTLPYSSYRPSSRSQSSSSKTFAHKELETATDDKGWRASGVLSSIRLSATSAHYSPDYRDDEADDEQATLPEKGDTAIVQNNYNVKMSTARAGATRSDNVLWTIIVGLLVVILVMGIILLATIWKLVMAMSDDGRRQHPMIVMPPPPGTNVKWAHDPIFEMPQGYQAGDEGSDVQKHFRDNELYPPKYE